MIEPSFDQIREILLVGRISNMSKGRMTTHLSWAAKHWIELLVESEIVLIVYGREYEGCLCPQIRLGSDVMIQHRFSV